MNELGGRRSLSESAAITVLASAQQVCGKDSLVPTVFSTQKNVWLMFGVVAPVHRGGNDENNMRNLSLHVSGSVKMHTDDFLLPKKPPNVHGIPFPTWDQEREQQVRV